MSVPLFILTLFPIVNDKIRRDIWGQSKNTDDLAGRSGSCKYFHSDPKYHKYPSSNAMTESIAP